jgi:hypothetical protein
MCGAPKGNIRAVKSIPKAEASCAYKEYLIATYKGNDFYVAGETQDKLLLGGQADTWHTKTNEPGVSEANIDEMWIPRTEGNVWVKREVF